MNIQPILFQKLTIKILILFALLFYSVKAQENTHENVWNSELGLSIAYKGSFLVFLSSLEDTTKMKSLWKGIGEDLKTEQNELAGTYVNLGADAGYFLRWSPNKGFVLIIYRDQSSVVDVSYGKALIDNNLIVTFTPERDLNYGAFFKTTPRKWTIIDDCFMPVEMIKDYGLYRAGLGGWNNFNGDCCDFKPKFLNRKLEGKKTSYPIQKQYLKYFKQPITGQIIYVGKKKLVKEWSYQSNLYYQYMFWTALIPVKVNIKRSRGIRKNMLLRLIGEPDGQYLQVMKVNKNHLEGFVVRWSFEEKREDFKETYFDYETDQEKPFPPIHIGMKVTTSPMIDE
jgi:hypothetical protein